MKDIPLWPNLVCGIAVFTSEMILVLIVFFAMFGSWQPLTYIPP